MTSFLSTDPRGPFNYQMVGAIGQSFKSVENSIFVLKNSTVLYFCGSCLVEKDIFTSEHKYYFREGLFTDVTMIDISVPRDDDATYITVAEVRPETTLITVLNLTKSQWYLIDLKERVNIAALKTNPKTKTVYYIEWQERQDEYALFSWNFEKAKKIGRLPLKHRYDKIENHPFRQKSVVLFSKIEVKMYEFKPQIKMFQERVHYLPLAGESGLVLHDIGWWIKKKTFLMIVLAQNNTVYLFFEDAFMKKICLDLSIISFTSFKLNSTNGFAELFLFNLNGQALEENDEENSSINLVRIVSLKKFVILASENFYLCFCKVHKHFQVDQNIGSHNLFYVHQGYRMALGDSGEGEESLFSVSANLHGSLLTIVSRASVFSAAQAMTATKSSKKKTTNPPKSKLAFGGEGSSMVMPTSSTNFGATNAKKEKREGRVAMKSDMVYRHYILNLNNVDLSSSPLRLFFPIGTHEDLISTVRVSRSKNIFISLGQTHGRIWDMSPTSEEKNNKLLPIASKEEQYLDFDIHPFGFFLAAGTLMNIKIFAILETKLSLVKEISNMLCTKLRYSSRAKYLVANEQHFVHCFETIHYNKLYTFTAHSKIIRDLLITDSQQFVISYCERMQLMMWEILDKPETFEDVEREVKLVTTVYKHESEELYTCFVYDEKNGFLICGGTSVFLRVYADLCRVLVLKIIDPSQSCLSMALEPSLGLLFVGNQNGAVRCYNKSTYMKYIPKLTDKRKAAAGKPPGEDLTKPREAVPLAEVLAKRGSRTDEDPEEGLEDKRQSLSSKKVGLPDGVQVIPGDSSGVVSIKITDFNNFKIANSGITNITLSPQNSQIIIAEEIGHLYVFNFNGGKKQLFSNPLIGAEINFVPKYKIQEEGRNIKQLMAEVERLKNVKGIEQEKMGLHLQNKLKLIEDKFQASLKENEKMKNRFQQKCQQTYEEDYEKYEKIKNENEAKLSAAKDSTAGILAFEQQKMEELRQRNAELRVKNEQELAALKEKHSRHLAEVQATLAGEIQELEAEYQKLLNRMKHYNNKFMNKISLEEADHEREILLYAQYLKKEIEKEKEGGAYFLVENETLSQQNNTEVTQIYAKQKTVEDLIIENTNLMEEKVKHSLSILKMQEQLLEREKVIINKECDLKQTVDVQKSLENFRFILDKKIAGFIANKGKVMERIREKEESIKRLFAELMHQNELNDVLGRSNTLQLNLLRLFVGQEKKKEAQIQYLALKFQGLCEKISAVVGSDATLARKKIEIKGLIADFDKVGFEDLDHTNNDFTNDKENKANSFTNCIEENARIRDDIANLLRKIELSHKSSKNQVLIEVSKTKNLIEECNKLRQENDYYQKLLKEMTAAVIEAKNSRARPTPVVLKNIG